LRTARAMGADRAVLIKSASDLEPLAIAKLLNEVVKREAPGIVLLGKQSIDGDNKSAGFARTERLIDEYRADCIVLARYMQILPQILCEKYRHKVINIHHSFLPSFIGAKPYHQASRRGVKLIGATCHYVTEELDEGPIIEQDVARVSHEQTVDDLVRLGKDVEKTVLARGLRNHLEDRVLVYGNKTVVL